MRFIAIWVLMAAFFPWPIVFGADVENHETNAVLTVQAGDSSGTGTYPFTIHVGSHRSKSHGYQQAQQMQRQGVDVFTTHEIIPGKGDWYRIYAGFFSTPAEAEIAAQTLKHLGVEYVNIVKKPYAIQVGLSSSEVELDRIAAQMEKMGYITYRLPDRLNRSQLRLLIGAYAAYDETLSVVQKLIRDGFEAKTVLR